MTFHWVNLALLWPTVLQRGRGIWLLEPLQQFCCCLVLLIAPSVDPVQIQFWKWTGENQLEKPSLTSVDRTLKGRGRSKGQH